MATKTQKSIELNANEVVEIEGVKIDSKVLNALRRLQIDGNDQLISIRESISNAIGVLLMEADTNKHDKEKLIDLSISLSYSREMICDLAAVE